MGLLQRLFGGHTGKADARRAAWATYIERVLDPQWDIVGAALGRPVPAILHELYADRELIARSHILVFDPAREERGQDPWWVSQFVPADAEALAPELESIPLGALAFATHECADPYYV